MNQLSVNPPAMMEKLASGDHASLAADILHVLDFFTVSRIEEADDTLLERIRLLATLIVKALTTPAFAIPPHLAPQFIRHNGVLANMIRLTDFKNADLPIKMLLGQEANFLKLLTLYSPYCTVRLNLDELFAAQPYLASLWAAGVLKGHWKGTKETDAFTQALMASPALANFTLQDSQFPLSEDAAFAYFDSTYASTEHDRRLRDTINAGMKRQFRLPFALPEPDMKRILVISANMDRQHSIYRCLAPLLDALKPDYHLTLFHNTPKGQDDLDRELFDEVKTLGVSEGDHFTYDMLQQVLDGRYGIALFTDIGLNRPSIILSNLRLAPIQITTYGHPVTSGDSEIDYFIGGEAVEEKNNPQRHYAEKLVLMPGLGVEPVRLDYTPSPPGGARDRLEIGLSWGEAKVTHPHLLRLRTIQEQASRPIRYHFIGFNATRLTLLAARRDLEALFGPGNVRISPIMPNADYLKTLESCDLLLDSSPFGSYNRIVDCLTLRKPVVALEGEKSYSRFAGALLRQAGLPELVGATPDEFIAIARRLIDDPSWRGAVMEKLHGLDIDSRLFETGHAAGFKKALDVIVKRHAAG